MRETGQYNAEKYKDKRHRVHCTAVLSWRLNGTYSRERREFIGRKGIANTLREILMKEQVPEEMTKASSKAFGIVIRFCGDKTAEKRPLWNGTRCIHKRRESSEVLPIGNRSDQLSDPRFNVVQIIFRSALTFRPYLSNLVVSIFRIFFQDKYFSLQICVYTSIQNMSFKN